MYSAPQSIDETVRLLAEGGATILAGGTDVYPSLQGGALDGPVIDIHCHRECAPATEMMSREEQRVGRVRLQYGSELTREVNRKQLEYIRPKMDFFETRLADMDAAGVDIQAVAVSPYQFYYWAEPEVGARASRMTNDELAEATSAHADRFWPLGTVPLQDTDAAIAELEYCIGELGFKGIEKLKIFIRNPDPANG